MPKELLFLLVLVNLMKFVEQLNVSRLIEKINSTYMFMVYKQAQMKNVNTSTYL